MPRSPSPPRYRDRRYRDDSPPRRYPRERGHDDYRRDVRPPAAPAATARDYRDSRDYRDRRRDWDDRDRPFIRDRSPGYTRPRSPLPISKPASSKGSPVRPLATPSGRSGTPEEGQITSPVPGSAARLPPRPRSPAHIPPSHLTRRRSPSPPPRWQDRPFRRDVRDVRDARDSRDWRDRDREQRGWDRERDRDRERERDWDRGREYHFPRRADHRPSRSPYRRSPSPSSVSSRSRSSRFTPPLRRSPERPSPRKYDSPAPRLPSPERRPSPPPPLPASVPVPRPSAFPSTRPPPSGPRSDRAPPTGPRALSGGYIRPNAFPPASGPPVQVKVERSERPLSPLPAQMDEERINPYRPTANIPPTNPGAPTSTMATATATGRLSWSERKTASPYDARPSAPQPPVASRTDSDEVDEVKREMEETPVVSRDVRAPDAVEGQEEHRPGVVLPVEKVEDKRAQEAEMRLLLDIQSISNAFGVGSWENELNAHFKHINALTHQTNKAQSAARIAAAVLADAEAERVAVVERRKTAEALLGKDTWDMGIIGVSTT